MNKIEYIKMEDEGLAAEWQAVLWVVGFQLMFTGLWFVTYTHALRGE